MPSVTSSTLSRASLFPKGLVPIHLIPTVDKQNPLLYSADFVDASVADEALLLMNEKLTWYHAGSKKAVKLVTTFIDIGFDGTALVLDRLVSRLHQWALEQRSCRALPGVSLFWSAVIRDSQTPFDMIF